MLTGYSPDSLQLTNEVDHVKPWPNVRNKQPTIQTEFRGVNKLDSFSISPVFSPDPINTTSTNRPSLSVRPGYTVLGTSFGRVLGLGVWKDTELHAVFSDGTWRKWTGSAWSSAIKSGLSTTALCSFTNYKGSLGEISLFMANGVNTLSYYNGSTVTDVGGAPAGINFIESHVDRLWGAVANTLYTCEYRVSTNWTTINQDDADPFNTEVETPNGETIDGVISSSDTLIVTKRNSIHKLFGYSAQDFTLRRVSREIGFLGNNTATIIKDAMYLLDDKSIYTYYGATSPDNAFALPVQDYIDRINQTAKAASCVGTDGTNLYVAIPISSSTAPDTILVFDFIANAWNVWSGFTPTCMVKMADELYMGDSTGRVIKLGGTTDNGTAINWRWTSVPYTAESMAQKVRIPRMWFTVELAAGSTLNLYLSKTESGNDWVLAKTFTSGSLATTPIYVPTNLLIGAQWYRYKLEGVGPCTVKEYAYEQHNMPIR